MGRSTKKIFTPALGNSAFNDFNIFKMWKGSKNGALKANTEGQLVLKKIKGYLWENSSFSKLTQINPLWHDLKKYI